MALRDGRWTYETEVHCFRRSAFALEMKQTDKYVCAARSFRTLPLSVGMVWHLADFTRRFLHKQCLVVEALHSESVVYFSLIYKQL